MKFPFLDLDPSTVLLLAFVILCSAFAFFSRRHLTLQAISFLNLAISLLFLAYYLYESFCVDEKDNIRSDLLFIHPALFALLCASIISWPAGVYFKLRVTSKTKE